jgi:thioredoxin reductase (NADPH)
MMAAVYAARAGLVTLILESTGAGGQILATSEIDNFPAFTHITGAELAMKMNEQVETCGVETVYEEILEIDIAGEEKTITCHEIKIVCKAIIIATGASPRKIGCEGEEKFLGAGIHFCALCDGAFYKDKDIIIAGGGNSAVEEALYLSPIAKTITVINMMPKFSAFGYLVERLESLPNVKVLHNTTMTKILGESKLGSVVTSNGETIKCDGVFVAIGRKPNTSFLGSAVDLAVGGYIAVNKKLETSVPGVYGAGDVCEKLVRQIVTACADGAIAATHAAEYVRGLCERKNDSQHKVD